LPDAVTLTLALPFAGFIVISSLVLNVTSSLTTQCALLQSLACYLPCVLDLYTACRWLNNAVDFLPFHFLFFGAGLAVLAAALNDLVDGAPLEPGLRIFSPLPALIRFRFAWMLS
jgi:hypothetical protein